MIFSQGPPLPGITPNGRRVTICRGKTIATALSGDNIRIISQQDTFLICRLLILRLFKHSIFFNGSEIF